MNASKRQLAMVMDLNKCLGCHTCTVACKTLWTQGEGMDYMWFNTVNTVPGKGTPKNWESMGGGFDASGNARPGQLPGRKDFGEAWNFNHDELYHGGKGGSTRLEINGEAPQWGPNWDEDEGGGAFPNSFHFYLPRICNHCLNPGCVAACPAGAIYKRGEDGIVLISQEKCRAWRMCISGCPYKKTYFNWSTGKSEKCILCYPRIESGQPPACFHSCVGRIRYLGVLLYDADMIEKAAAAPDASLVDAQRAMIMDPFDPAVIASAKANGVPENMIDAAQKSPVYKFVKEWGIALPLHPEFRTVPMLFYVPPMLPVLAKTRDGNYEVDQTGPDGLAPMLSALEKARVPIKFMASLFSAGNSEVIADVYRKLIAVRVHRRYLTVGDVSQPVMDDAFAVGGTDAAEAEAIFRLTALPTYDERFVVPAMNRESAIETIMLPLVDKQETGFGFRQAPERRF